MPPAGAADAPAPLAVTLHLDLVGQIWHLPGIKTGYMGSRDLPVGWFGLYN